MANLSPTPFCRNTVSPLFSRPNTPHEEMSDNDARKSWFKPIEFNNSPDPFAMDQGNDSTARVAKRALGTGQVSSPKRQRPQVSVVAVPAPPPATAAIASAGPEVVKPTAVLAGVVVPLGFREALSAVNRMLEAGFLALGERN